MKSFLERPAIDAAAERLARRVLAAIQTQGDVAVARYAQRFDGVSLRPAQFQVGQSELAAARRQIDAAFAAAARAAHRRIAAFARAGLKRDWAISTAAGGRLGEQFRPLDRIGVYIPGGSAPLVSSALMTVTLAKVAGVRQIVACSPAGPSGRLHPYLLHALELAGADAIYKIGGIQAIGAMAYGTATIPKVQKIVGPGGPYVTAAKRCVYGAVALDMVAGPSEIAVLADESAAPAAVAADLLSQAEHGTGFEKCLLVTTAPRLATAVKKELLRQAQTLSRRVAIRRVLERGTLIVVVRDLMDGMELCNQFAPEHLELMVRRPRVWLKRVRHAGAVFLGPYTPESVGDFAAGPSHVLPTGGTAAMFSGLTVDDFRKRTSFMAFTRADLKAVLPIIEAFSRVEGLDAHAQSARLRFGFKA
ncbi:MAG: histidinol dehydrogenase [Lentisphaerae bacterium]|nr:histidinol dehydrogenase [Lentisphaerota bacterium]